jgi:hypothetical protein
MDWNRLHTFFCTSFWYWIALATLYVLRTYRSLSVNSSLRRTHKLKYPGKQGGILASYHLFT